jgi:hypothetical protein
MFIKKKSFVHVFKFLSKVDILVFGLDPMYEAGFTEMELLKLQVSTNLKGRWTLAMGLDLEAMTLAIS